MAAFNTIMMISDSAWFTFLGHSV